ncbi:MAG: hypothetical protein NWP69_03640, partial [Congregibacter sp.]|nr:hypothetical protein [Congregibacter sp.]
YLARRLGQMTSFGAFLDPVADKLMVAVALVLLVERHNDLLFTLAACVIIGREIVVSALREWMAELGQRTSVAVSMIGKVKTGFQMVSIVVLLAVDAERDGNEILALGVLLLYVAFVVAPALVLGWNAIIEPLGFEPVRSRDFSFLWRAIIAL